MAKFRFLLWKQKLCYLTECDICILSKYLFSFAFLLCVRMERKNLCIGYISLGENCIKIALSFVAVLWGVLGNRDIRKSVKAITASNLFLWFIIPQKNWTLVYWLLWVWSESFALFDLLLESSETMWSISSHGWFFSAFQLSIKFAVYSCILISPKLSSSRTSW